MCSFSEYKAKMEALHISSPFYEGNRRGCQAADICEKQAKYIMNKHTVKKSENVTLEKKNIKTHLESRVANTLSKQSQFCVLIWFRVCGECPPITVWPAWHEWCGTSCTGFGHQTGSSHQRPPLWKGDGHNPHIGSTSGGSSSLRQRLGASLHFQGREQSAHCSLRKVGRNGDGNH